MANTHLQKQRRLMDLMAKFIPILLIRIDCLIDLYTHEPSQKMMSHTNTRNYDICAIVIYDYAKAT